MVNFITMSTLRFFPIIVCAIAYAIVVTTSDQTINLTALTGDLCRVSSNVDAIPNAKCRHRFRWCPEPIAFVISPSPFLLLLLIIRGGDVHQNPGPTKRQCSAGCGKGIIASSKAISCDGCDAWTHARCSDSISVRQYDRLARQLATFDYLCNTCLIRTLPFAHTQENADDISITVAYGAGDTQANDADISTTVAGGAGDSQANDDDISTTVAGGAGDSQAYDDDISTTVAGGAGDSQAYDDDISNTVAGGAGDSQAYDDDISNTVAGGADDSLAYDDDISTTVAGGAGDSQAYDDDISTTVAGGGVDSQANDDDISTTVAGGAGDSQANDDDISTTVAGGAGDSQANDDDISTTVAGGAGDSQANDADISTTVAGGDSQANDDDISTTIAGGGVDSQANDDDISTTVAGGAGDSQANDADISTTVAGGNSQANDDDISTTVAGGAGDSQANDADISTTVAGGAGDSQANDDDISTTITGGGVDSEANDDDISTTVAGGAGDSQANDDDISTTVAGAGDSQAIDDDISTTVAGGAGDSQANDDDISTTVAGGGVDSQANDDDISTTIAGGGGDSQAIDNISTMVAGGAGDSQANDDDAYSIDSCDDIYEVFCGKGLHFLHLNIRSLPPNIDEIRTIANRTKAAVIALTETWLDDSVNDSEISINNYCIIRADRNRQGGGVCLYIRENLTFNPRIDIKTDSIETLWVEILQPKTKPILVGVAYRPPSQSDFYDIFEQTCHQIDDSNKHEIIILGDFNTDMKGPLNSNLRRRLLEFQTTFDLDQLIVEPTRITPTSRTIIDLILVSDPAKISQSGVIEIGVSDHFLTYCTRKITKVLYHKHNNVKIRSLKNYNRETFEQRLKDATWSEVYSCESVEGAWLAFKSRFQTIVDSLAPLKEIRIKQSTAPWITAEIIHTRSERDKALRKFKHTNYECWHNMYLHLRNEVQYKTKVAKANYYEAQVEENKNNPTKLWQTLKSLGTSSRSKCNSKNIGLKIDNEMCFDKVKVAEQFNNFFTTVASSLVNKLPQGTGTFGDAHVSSFYQGKGVTPNAFCLNEVNVDNINIILNSMSANKATGLDDLSPRFVKDGARVIAPMITHIVNMSIRQGIIPDDLKRARVIPIHKKGRRTDPSMYRPISILSTISKVIEKVIHDQVFTYLKTNGLLYEFQSGFRQSYSTNTCLIHLTDYIKLQSDKGNLTGMVLLDLQKAFDTVDHCILINKLQALGFDTCSREWFRSYLTNRKQLVDIAGTLSPFQNVTCGVPQGSILGPLLFLVYVNDMCSAVNCKLLLYADDSALIVPGKDVKEIELQLTKELKSISNWLTDNKLSLHLGKTESILFGTKKKLQCTSTQLSVTCGGRMLSAKSTVKYLGVELDQHLSGEYIARNATCNIHKKVKFLLRNTNFFNMKVKKMLTTALIQCHFDYASASWFSGLSQKNKSKFQVLQNKVVRYLLNLTPRTHVGVNEFKAVTMLPVNYRVDQLKLNLMFNINHGMAPSYIFSSRVRDQHSIGTRSREYDVVVPRVRGPGSSTFAFTAAKLWNALPANIQRIDTPGSFRRAVLMFLVRKYESYDSNPFLYS